MRLRRPLSLWRVPTWPGTNPCPRPVILLYHSVNRVATDPWGLRVSPRNFAEQMAVLRAHTHPLRLDQLGEALDRGTMPDRCVVVTFDDGFADNLSFAKPTLERNSVPGTVFVSSGYVGTKSEFWWDELDRILLQPGVLPDRLKIAIGSGVHEWSLGAAARLGRLDAWKARQWRAWHEHDPSPRYSIFRSIWQLLRTATTEDREMALKAMRGWAGLGETGRPSHLCCTHSQLQELANGDLIEIGAHTVTHPSLGAISADQQQREIRDCKAMLESVLDRPVTSFSYPFGSRQDYTSETIRLLKEAGFRRTCSNFSGAITPAVDRFQYPRRVVLDWSGDEFCHWLTKWFDATG